MSRRPPPRLEGPTLQQQLDRLPPTNLRSGDAALDQARANRRAMLAGALALRLPED